MARQRLATVGRWLVAVAVFTIAVWMTWVLVRPEPYTGPQTLLGWDGVGFDPNVPYDRQYGWFGYMRVRDYYTDYDHGRKISGERWVWRDRQSIYTIAAIAGVWLAARWCWSRLATRRT